MKQQTSGSRRFSLRLYLAIVFGVSWPFQIAGVIWASTTASVYALNGCSMVMVAVGTFIAGRYLFRDGFANAGWRWGKPKHYFSVLALAAILWILPTLADLGLRTVNLPACLTRQQIALVFVFLFVTLIPAFGEEFGWRGYMLPRMMSRMGMRKAVFLHGVIWWAWHLPVQIGPHIRDVITGAENPGISVVMSGLLSAAGIAVITAIPCILHAVVFAYIWSQSRSLAVATVYHAAYDGVRDSLRLTIGAGPVTGAWASLVLVVLGLVLLRKRKEM